MPRPLPAVLALGLALAPGGAAEDPFLAVLRAGPGGVAAPRPGGDPLRDAVSWNLRDRREVVDDLAALILRGELPRSDGDPAAVPSRPPRRTPPGARAAPPGRALRLAAHVPADAAVLFLESVRHGERVLERAAERIPGFLPALGDGPQGVRDAVRRAVERLLLPTIWRANPGVPTGTGAVAVVAGDPDLRGAPDLAVVVEITDLGRLTAHRRAAFRWESGRARFRTDGLDAWTDDGSVRSFFAVEGGVALFSTSRSLRGRIVATCRGERPSLSSTPDLAAARATFPREPGDALLVIPDAFLARVNGADLRLRRAGALACEAMRLLVDARSLAPAAVGPDRRPALDVCPAGGRIHPVAGSPGAVCTAHGNARNPVPAGDAPPWLAAAAALERLRATGDPVMAGRIPQAARMAMPTGGSPPAAGLRVPGPGTADVQIALPAGAPGRGMFETLVALSRRPRVSEAAAAHVHARLEALGRRDRHAGDAGDAYERLTGLRPPAPPAEPPPSRFPRSLRWRTAGGVLVLEGREPFQAKGYLVAPRARWR